MRLVEYQNTIHIGDQEIPLMDDRVSIHCQCGAIMNSKNVTKYNMIPADFETCQAVDKLAVDHITDIE